MTDLKAGQCAWWRPHHRPHLIEGVEKLSDGRTFLVFSLPQISNRVKLYFEEKRML